MKQTCVRSLVVLLLLSVSLPAAAQAAKPQDSSAPDRKQVVRRARDAYYSLHRLGVNEFEANIQPDWRVTLKKEIESDPQGAENGLRMLNGLHFHMLLDQAGKVTMTHKSDAEPPNERARQAYEQIYSGMDQAVDGLFQTWGLFMLTSPFPEVESEYRLEDLGSQYRLSYEDGTAHVITMMGKDLQITMITVTSPGFSSVVRPRLSATPAGFVMVGYVADYTPAAGKGAVQLDVTIENGNPSGYVLPSRVAVHSVLDEVPTDMALDFSAYQVRKK